MTVLHDPRARNRTRSLLGWPSNETNRNLVRALRARGIDAALVPPSVALATLGPGDRALSRLDVLPGLDGVEPGLLALLLLERRGVDVLNRAVPMLIAHDKLRTAAALAAAGLPHPQTRHVPAGETARSLEAPLVLKPRFGSWGRDVFRCDSRADVERTLEEVRDRAWFRKHGAIAQELLPPRGSDLRVIVARGEVIGAARRVAAPGEWRTNISLGGSLEPVAPGSVECELACAAAAAIGAHVVGVDLMSVDGGYAVLELNGAVDFDTRYGLDVYDRIADALTR